MNTDGIIAPLPLMSGHGPSLRGLKGMGPLICSHPAALEWVMVKKVGLLFIHQEAHPYESSESYRSMKELMIGGHPVERQ